MQNRIIQPKIIVCFKLQHFNMLAIKLDKLHKLYNFINTNIARSGAMYIMFIPDIRVYIASDRN